MRILRRFVNIDGKYYSIHHSQIERDLLCCPRSYKLPVIKLAPEMTTPTYTCTKQRSFDCEEQTTLKVYLIFLLHLHYLVFHIPVVQLFISIAFFILLRKSNNLNILKLLYLTAKFISILVP